MPHDRPAACFSSTWHRVTHAWWRWASPRRTVLPHASALGLLAALAACSHPSAPTPAATGKADATSSTAPAAGTSASEAGPILVPTHSTYDVTLKPETKIIDAAAMARAYRGANSDGTLAFDAAAAPEVAAMTPGTVAIFAGVALLRVSSVTSAGGKIAVAGTPVGLEDTIDHGHIAWSVPLDFTKVAFSPPPAALLCEKSPMRSSAVGAVNCDEFDWVSE